MPKRERNFRFLPQSPVRTPEEWLSMESGFLAGEREAYEFVFKEVWFMATRFVARAYRGRVCSMYHDIMDMSGEATLNAMLGMAYWEPGKNASLRTWAYAGTKIAAWRIRHARWEKKQRAAISLDSEDQSGRKIWQLTAAPSSECEAERRERVEFVGNAIDSLPPHWATLIKRHYGFAGPEASLVDQGRELGVSGQAMGQKLARAIERLAGRLTESGLTYETI